MNVDELPVLFRCAGESLVGIVARPAQPAETGVLVIVGGPQYRVGSHRQFVHLARYLAAEGIACMRFDYRGMGDSSGAMRTFEDVSEDIGAALDVFLRTVPEVKRAVLWGLCDAASAACFYAPGDSRVAGLALLNPWVRTEAGEATTYLRHYYVQRLLSAAFWKKFLGGGVRVGESARGLRRNVAGARSGNARTGLPARMAECAAGFRGGILVVLSEADLVAAEFRDASKSPDWRSVLESGRTQSRQIAGATHTFSSEAWRNEVARATLEWLRALPAESR